jgi:GTP-binding protein
MDSSYITSAMKPQQLQDFGLPEYAVFGRSNCGKSSLINALLGRRALARTSSTPGRTAMVNYFKVKATGGEFIFADLPGYGYSTGTTAGDRKHWQELVTRYLEQGSTAPRTYLFLVDSRRAVAAPFDQDDEMILRFLAKGSQSVLIVLTKVDKLNTKETQAARKETAARLAELGVTADFVLTSASKKTGVAELQKRLFG